MRITYDPIKRAETLANRNLDFEDAPEVFAGNHFQMEDDRRDYGETRWATIGWLDGAIVMVIWTPRGDAHHVISMRKCNERERRKFRVELE